MTIRELAALAGVGASTLYAAESGQVAGLDTYVRLARALRLRLELTLADPRRRGPVPAPDVDPVHAAMGEMEAAHLRNLGFKTQLDEPYQHFQFAGRTDLIAWSTERSALLHVENRTRFPNLQEAFGSFSAKRAYAGREIAERVGLPRWRSETHVVVALWSAEVLHAVRLHQASFASLCPDGIEAFEAWWRGEPPATGRVSAMLLFDSIEGRRRDRRRWVALAEAATARPRYAGYADALAALRDAGRA
jgi:hypothetical protein